MADAHMGPVNATIRFLCELVAVYGIAAGTWAATGSILLTIVTPVAASAVWAVFRVPDDPGPAPIAVPGPGRLGIEAVVFGAGVAGLGAASGAAPATVYLAVLVAHYATTPRRLRHVLSPRRPAPDAPDRARHSPP